VTRDLPSGDLVDRLRRFCFHLLRYPNYGALTVTPAGLSPAEHASLTWTHLRTKNRQQTKNDHLTGKAPYRFESGFLQRRIRTNSTQHRRLEPASNGSQGESASMSWFSSIRRRTRSTSVPESGRSNARFLAPLRVWHPQAATLLVEVLHPRLDLRARTRRPVPLRCRGLYNPATGPSPRAHWGLQSPGSRPARPLIRSGRRKSNALHPKSFRLLRNLPLTCPWNVECRQPPLLPPGQSLLVKP
jgi:hypothetical protein